MKLYNPIPPLIMRINIKQQGRKTEHISVWETTQPKCIELLKEILKPFIPAFTEGKRTTVEIREGQGKKNGKCKSFAFYGLSPEEVKQILLKEIKE